ncbi:MAG: prepilin-type N-terminal cleavage/methylation domain-containing protein [Gemmatimonadota bacterium]
MRASGFTLVELLIATVIAATLVSIGVGSLSGARERAALNGAADAVTRQLALGRAVAVARRETVRLTRRDRELALLDSRGAVLSVLALGRGDDLPLDSVVVRPSSIRFNARGHAGAGSIYLWRGGRGVRLVTNFLGRVRREPVP